MAKTKCHQRQSLRKVLVILHWTQPAPPFPVSCVPLSKAEVPTPLSVVLDTWRTLLAGLSRSLRRPAQTSPDFCADLGWGELHTPLLIQRRINYCCFHWIVFMFSHSRYRTPNDLVDFADINWGKYHQTRRTVGWVVLLEILSDSYTPSPHQSIEYDAGFPIQGLFQRGFCSWISAPI